MEENQELLTPTEFCERIDNLALRENVGLYEAIKIYCEDNDLDVESVMPLINVKSFRDRLKQEAINKNMIRLEDSQKEEPSTIFGNL